MKSLVLWALAVTWCVFMAHQWRDNLTPGLSLAIGAYATIWFIAGKVMP